MLDPVTVHEQIVEKSTPGGHDSLVRTKYVAPTDDYGNPRHDPYARSDVDLSRYIYTFLMTRLPIGYEWGVTVQQEQGIIDILIPVLTGFRNGYRINMKTTPIDQGVLRGANELLERYRLSRTRFNLGALLEVRETHSGLVVPTRRIPGGW